MEDDNSRESSALTLIVKSPTGVCEDQTVSGVLLTWTVKELKGHLSRVHPWRPPETEQRLIYCGKLLRDTQLLRDAFLKSNIMPTIHLVCVCKPQPGGGPVPRVQTAAEKDCTAGLSSPLAPHTPAVTPATFQGNGLRNRGHPTDQSSTQSGCTGLGAAMTRPVFPAYSLYSPQQLLWLQQVYAQQYYMHYRAALAAAVSARAPVSSSATHSLPVDPQPAAAPVTLPNLPADQNVPAAPEFNPAGGNQNLRMNAQGGPVMEEEEEDVERDWLDWLYTVARFAVLLSIVYFYSSISRFVLVMSSLLLMYLHTAGWFPFRREGPAVVRLREPRGPEAAENREEQQADVPAMEADAAEGGDTGHPAQRADLAEPQRVPLVSTAWVFFKAFFASLVPDVPQPLVN